jgi:hypothetical protein
MLLCDANGVLSLRDANVSLPLCAAKGVLSLRDANVLLPLCVAKGVLSLCVAKGVLLLGLVVLCPVCLGLVVRGAPSANCRGTLNHW